MYTITNLATFRVTISDFFPPGPQPAKRESSGFVSNKDADQPAHPHSLIRAFVIRSLESIISKLAVTEILIFLLVSVAEPAGLCISLF